MTFRLYYYRLYDGMTAGTDLYVDALGHDLTIGDLKVWIAMYDIGAITPLGIPLSLLQSTSPASEACVKSKR